MRRMLVVVLSQPAWAAWIEIMAVTTAKIRARSQPAWAAWIEMILNLIV